MNSSSDDNRSSPENSDQTSHQTRSNFQPRGFFDRIVASCKEPTFYKIPLFESGKKAFYYSLKLFLLIGIVSGIFFSYTQWKLSQQILTELSNQIPQIQFQNGKLDINADTPFKMTVLDKYDIFLDPKGSLNRLELPQEAKIIVVNGAILLRQGKKKFTSWSTRTHSESSQTEPILINSKYIQSWAGYIELGVVIVTLLASIVAVILRNYLRVAILVPAGKFLFSSDELNLNWKSVFKIGCYAITPIVVAETILLVLNFKPHYMDYFILGAGIFWFYYILQTIAESVSRIDEDNPLSA